MCDICKLTLPSRPQQNSHECARVSPLCVGVGVVCDVNEVMWEEIRMHPADQRTGLRVCVRVSVCACVRVCA